MLALNSLPRRSFHAASASLLAAAFLALPAQTASANLLTAGSTIATLGTTVATRPELAGLVLADVLRPFTILEGIGSISGNFQDRVIMLYDNGVDASGGTHLSFEFTIRDTTAVSEAATHPLFPLLQTIARTDYDTGLTTFTDVDVRLDSPGTRTSDSASRSAGVGSVITFLYANGIDGSIAEQTHETFIRTAASAYDAFGTVTLTTVGGSSVTFNVFEPTDIPSPVGASVLALGVLVTLRRRR